MKPFAALVVGVCAFPVCLWWYALSSSTGASDGREAAHLRLGTGVRGLAHLQNSSRSEKNRPCGSPHSVGFAICSPRGIGDPHDMRPRGSQHLSCAPICLRRGLPQGGGGWINISDFRARKSFPISDLRRRARRLSVNVVVTCALPVVAALKTVPVHALSTLFKRARATGAHQSARLDQMAGVGCCPSCINSSPACR